MKTIVSSEPLKVVKVVVQGAERSDTLNIGSPDVDVPDVMEVLRSHFGGGPSESVSMKPRQMRGKRRKNAAKGAA